MGSCRLGGSGWARRRRPREGGTHRREEGPHRPRGSPPRTWATSGGCESSRRSCLRTNLRETASSDRSDVALRRGRLARGANRDRRPSATSCLRSRGPRDIAERRAPLRQPPQPASTRRAPSSASPRRRGAPRGAVSAPRRSSGPPRHSLCKGSRARHGPRGRRGRSPRTRWRGRGAYRELSPQNEEAPALAEASSCVGGENGLSDETASRRATRSLQI